MSEANNPFDIIMTSDFIEAAQGSLMLVAMKLGKNDLQAAVKQASMAASMLSNANQAGLAQEANLLAQLLNSGRIDEGRKKLSELQAKVSQLVGEEEEDIREHKPHMHIVKEILCPYCHGNTPQHSKFCPNCGKNLQEGRCQGCNSQVPPGAKFCIHCGRRQ